jgi:hypothetical protein
MKKRERKIGYSSKRKTMRIPCAGGVGVGRLWRCSATGLLDSILLAGFFLKKPTSLLDHDSSQLAHGGSSCRCRSGLEDGVGAALYADCCWSRFVTRCGVSGSVQQGTITA